MKSENLLTKELEIIKTQISDIQCESQELCNLLKDFLSGNSKLIRSTISILFLKMLGYKLTDEQYKICLATELIHNASLLHDDVIDNSKLRRNQKTINDKHNNHIAVIAGDYLMSYATQILLELKNYDVLNYFFKATSNMCIGEASQNFKKDTIPTLDEYLNKTQMKTAELFIACICSLCLFADKSLTERAKDFAKNFGIAFQIKNDLDDYKLGKYDSQDMQNKIYTAPVILTKNQSDNNAIEKTLNLIDNYCQKSIQILDRFDNNEFKRELLRIIDNLCK